jgi:geranylgeranyl pyrophosphate synthase
MELQDLKVSLDGLKLEMTGTTTSNLTHELNDLVHAGGKKFRPGLLFLIGELFSLKLAELTTYARAVELTHLASLVHDDVIDESDKRRNHPTLNSIRNNTTAILAGDYLLASVMGELALKNNNEILIDLTRSIQDLADGEWLQYDLKRKERVEVQDLELIAIKKTGSLIRWCCTTPGKLAQFKDIDTLGILGEKVGLIFQMADDIVDGLTVSGRPAFQDITNGQMNYVTLKLIELYPELSNGIYAIKGNSGMSVPWTNTQYQKAIEAVHDDINDERDKVLSTFASLCRMNNKEELMPLFGMMIHKIQSNYMSFFENLSDRQV